MGIFFTDYIKYRATLRGFDLKKIENMLHYSQEKYFDIETQRKIIIGKQDNTYVMVPYSCYYSCYNTTTNKIQTQNR